MERAFALGRKKIEGEPGDDDVLRGTNGDDTIVGHSGEDKLNGRGGDDILYGGKDKDKLEGGAGDDEFRFNLIGSKHRDKIVDFDHGDDQFGLDKSVFGLTGNKLAGTVFFAGDEAHDRNDRIIYDKDTGFLYFDADGNRKGEAFILAKLADKDDVVTTEPVRADDFLLF